MPDFPCFRPLECLLLRVVLRDKYGQILPFHARTEPLPILVFRYLDYLQLVAQLRVAQEFLYRNTVCVLEVYQLAILGLKPQLDGHFLQHPRIIIVAVYLSLVAPAVQMAQDFHLP